MPTEEFNKAYKNAADSTAYKDQQAGIDQLRQMAALAAQRPAQLDLSPLLALTDSQTGSHLLAGYQHPESTQQRLADAFNAAQKIQQDQRDLSKNIFDTVVKQKGGFLLDYQQQLARSGLTYGANDPFMKRNMVAPVNDFIKETQTESAKIRDNDEQMQKVLVALNSYNPAAQKGVPIQLARILEGARPAMQAAATESGDPSAVQRFDRFYSKLTTGQLTDEDVGQFTQYIHDMQGVNEQNKRGLMARWLASGRALGLDDATINSIIPNEWINPHKAAANKIYQQAPKPKNVGRTTVDTPSPQSGGDPGMDAFLKSRGGQ
jgi:hypothetical protein